MTSHLTFLSFSLNISEAEDYFICSQDICISSSVKCLTMSFANFLLVRLSFLPDWSEFFIYLCSNPFLVICLSNIFSWLFFFFFTPYRLPFIPVLFNAWSVSSTLICNVCSVINQVSTYTWVCSGLSILFHCSVCPPLL